MRKRIQNFFDLGHKAFSPTKDASEVVRDSVPVCYDDVLDLETSECFSKVLMDPKLSRTLRSSYMNISGHLASSFACYGSSKLLGERSWTAQFFALSCMDHAKRCRAKVIGVRVKVDPDKASLIMAENLFGMVSGLLCAFGRARPHGSPDTCQASSKSPSSSSQ